MADSESDVETDGLESALDSLYKRHCSDQSSLNSKSYCSEFCELVEEYTGQWQVPLPQLKVLWTALCSFTKATAAFPDDCQHVHYVLSSMALSFFELMLFFSKEEFVEKPLKDILDSFQECHSRLLRHRNIYLQHVKQIIKAGGPWENPVLQGILKEADMSPKDVEDYLSSELPVFLELRVRYLQACERMQEAKVLAKSCLENHEAGKHLFFHQAYLTCLYKASLHEHLHKEMAEIDGRDAVEIICNTESVEKDELLLSLCKAFLKQQLHNGDMYYIWDLVFIWSRLHLRAHPSRQGFLAECLLLASSATNIRAIFPFIKLVTAELGHDGVHVCVELCARALQLCDLQSDTVTRSLVCKTIAFLLPHDLEICRACALLVFCQERSLEAYRTVCSLYMHPDQEPHPHNSPVRTSVRFHILQMLKERLCFDPEFWNLLTLRTHCLELMSDKVVKAAVLSELKAEEEKEYSEELLVNDCVNESCAHGPDSCRRPEAAPVNRDEVKEQPVNGQSENGVAPPHNAHLKRRKWKRRRKEMQSDDEADVADDPEIKYNVKSSAPDNKPVYSLRRNHTRTENSAAAKLPMKRNREYLSRCVKSQIFKRKGRKKRWLQGLPRAEPVQPVKERKVKGKKRGRKPLQKLELSYPDNEMSPAEEEPGLEEVTDMERSEEKENRLEPRNDLEGETGLGRHTEGRTLERSGARISGDPPSDGRAAVPSAQAAPELDGPLLELSECPVELLHNYCLKPRKPGDEDSEPLKASALKELDGDGDGEPGAAEDTSPEVMAKRTWRDRLLRTQQHAHVMFHCKFCQKDYKGLNVMRHALSHLKRRKLRCILCGKRFKQLQFAKKHIIEHIDEMCKQRPADKEPHAADTPAANGVADHVEDRDQPQDESQTSSVEEAPEQKPAKPKWSSLKREDRIIRNLRTLIKKTSVLHKKCKNPDANIFKLLDFKDEQVVIRDGLVIVRDPYVIEEGGEAEGGGGGGETKEQERPADQNGYGVDITYHLCPSESCDRVFLRSSSTIIRHAIKCHSDDEKVLEKTFVWAKNKCTMCLRQIPFLQQYKDHMKLHDTPLQHFCYHLDCTQRFLTHQELKNHIGSHKPLRAQCPFANCDKLFPSLQGLYDHEWRHYVPTPQKDELELGPSRQKTESAEAPWKQRVKVEETWLQGKKGQREGPALDHAAASRLKENVEAWSSDGRTKRADSDSEAARDPATVNGYSSDAEEAKGSASHTGAAAGTPRRRSSPASKKSPQEQDPLDVRNLEDLSTLAEGVQKKLDEPHITEHKSFKPEDPSYATFVKAPFIRPPPSTYMDESLLSMRKRRSTEEAAPRKSTHWSYRRKADPTPAKQQEARAEPPEPKTRFRCDKCLSSFSSVDELEKHKALNTCSALFGFDSDDEG